MCRRTKHIQVAHTNVARLPFGSLVAGFPVASQEDIGQSWCSAAVSVQTAVNVGSYCRETGKHFLLTVTLRVRVMKECALGVGKSGVVAADPTTVLRK